MPRIARKNLNTPFLHIMVQGVNKEYIFYNEKYMQTYLKLIREYIKNYNVTLIAYCIMNNHAHFLVYVKDVAQIGLLMHKVNTIFSQKFNRQEERCGTIFRNRFKSEPIYNNNYLINCINYIHNNPVKANIVKTSENYKYSSYMEYINGSEITKSKIMCDLFGENYDYKKIFKNCKDRKLQDIDKLSKKQINEYIENGVIEFLKKEKKKLIEVLEQEVVLKKLIIFLNIEWGIKYKDVQEYLNISRWLMDKIKYEK